VVQSFALNEDPFLGSHPLDTLARPFRLIMEIASTTDSLQTDGLGRDMDDAYQHMTHFNDLLFVS
jgi:hypothetical protein